MTRPIGRLPVRAVNPVMDVRPTVSVVVAADVAHDSGPFPAGEALTAVEWPAERLEVVVASVGGAPPRSGWANRAGRIVTAETRSAALNAGAAAATGFYVGFLDARQALDPAWLKRSVSALLADATIACVGLDAG